MYLQPVLSSNIEAIGYDPAARILRVRFIHGRTYDYASVPDHVHSGLMAAASHGSFLAQYVKGVYSYTHVG